MTHDPLTYQQDHTPLYNSAQGKRLYMKTPYFHINPLDYHSIDTIIETFNYYQ
jgi:hypothetical protein